VIEREVPAASLPALPGDVFFVPLVGLVIAVRITHAKRSLNKLGLSVTLPRPPEKVAQSACAANVQLGNKRAPVG